MFNLNYFHKTPVSTRTKFKTVNKLSLSIVSYLGVCQFKKTYCMHAGLEEHFIALVHAYHKVKISEGLTGSDV